MNGVKHVTSKMFPIVSPLINMGAAVATERFLKRDPLAEQRQIFFSLLRRAATTKFGRDYGFADIAKLPFEAAYERYRRTVPVRCYADFWRDYFSNGYQEDPAGKQLTLRDVTWPGLITLFCETSGTTAPTKHIPFSNEMFHANRRAAFDMMACYLHHHPRSRLLGGRFLYMSGSTALSSLGNGIHSGDMSAITLRFAPAYLKPFVAPSPEISSLPWDDKLEALARLLLMDRDITGISGVPPWILLLLQRCTELGKAPLAKLLPRLELIVHGGTSLRPYRSEFSELFGKRSPNFLELLPSSEAFMGFQVAGEPNMRLTPYYGTFFEFIPFDQLGEQGQPGPDAKAVPLAAIDKGERYAVLLSTCSGLWRYHIGDTLRVTSKTTLAIEFTGRDKFLDRFEEKVTQSEVEQAVVDTSIISQVEIREFMVGPDIGARRHVWVLAVKGDLPSQASLQLALQLDKSLMQQNADYATFRRQDRIKPPEVITVEEDVIYSWSKDVRGKLGGQSKIPHIDPTLEGDLLKSLMYYAAN
ncbi:GH3 family domain-containing protein [Geoanaerobacter pelophilus]